jgi:hypothetical protein
LPFKRRWNRCSRTHRRRTVKLRRSRSLFYISHLCPVFRCYSVLCTLEHAFVDAARAHPMVGCCAPQKGALEEAENWKQLCDSYEAKLAQQQPPPSVAREASDASPVPSAERAAATTAAGKDAKLGESGKRTAPKPSLVPPAASAPHATAPAAAAQAGAAKPPDQAGAKE